MRKIITLMLLLSILFPNLYAQRYEAEDALLTGEATIGNSITGFSGTGYVDMKQTGSLLFNCNVEKPGFYNLIIGFHAVYGDKKQNLKVNDLGMGEVAFSATETFSTVEAAKKIRLEKGENTVEISMSWGWMIFDYIEFIAYEETPFRIDATLVNPAATDGTVELYDFLKENFGRKVISGVMTLQGGEENSMKEPDWLFDQTGKYPALLGLDFMHQTGKDNAWYVNDPVMSKQVVRDAENYYRRNGIPALCWHWRDPLKKTDAFYTDATDFDLSKVFDKTSAEYLAMIEDIDVIAAQLLILQSKGVPVLWRPLHEAAGGWFWWGAKGAAPCVELWKVLYDRLVNHHGLNNLIWVWTADADDTALDWYPGHDFVDIVGIDIYPPEGDHNAQVVAFEKLKQLFEGRKILTLSECGSIPDPDAMAENGSYWSYFMPWYGKHTIPEGTTPHNTVDFWQKTMNHDLILTLDEMPGWNSPVSVKSVEGNRDVISFIVDKQSVMVRSEYPIRQINLLDINGRRLSSATCGNFEAMLPLSSALSSGVYLIQVQHDGGGAVAKLVR